MVPMRARGVVGYRLNPYSNGTMYLIMLTKKGKSL